MAGLAGHEHRLGQGHRLRLLLHRPRFRREGAVNWLLLKAVGAEVGPDGGDTLSDTTFIQRLNTSGGLAQTDCASSADVGKQAFVPYTADYFYKEDSTNPATTSVPHQCIIKTVGFLRWKNL